MTHLYEVDHPYYATSGNYFSNDYYTQYASWDEFFQAEGNMDPDLNLVYRWDWNVPDPKDYLPYGEDLPEETFSLFFIMQRKACCRSVEFPVKREDEDAIRAWLVDRAKTMTAIWQPLDLNPKEEA